MDKHKGPEWDLRYTYGTQRVLISRYDGGPWEDIGTFDSYNDAERVLRLIHAGRPEVESAGADAPDRMSKLRELSGYLRDVAGYISTTRDAGEAFEQAAHLVDVILGGDFNSLPWGVAIAAPSTDEATS